MIKVLDICLTFATLHCHGHVFAIAWYNGSRSTVNLMSLTHYNGRSGIEGLLRATILIGRVLAVESLICQLNLL